MILWILKPRCYNTPINFRMLWNQWAHQLFLCGWWSYETYADLQVDPFTKKWWD